MERISYLISAVVITAIVSQLLIGFGDATPYIDAITTVFSIVGLILTVKRCVEQWYVWFIVNGLSVIMWVEAYINGSNCFATILMWITYFILSIYFLHTWKKELKDSLC
jgi:nicotinamide mononucleotide transporter